MKNRPSLEDLCQIATKCRQCSVPGQAYTFKWILEDTESPLGHAVEQFGFAEVTCADCLTTEIETL